MMYAFLILPALIVGLLVLHLRFRVIFSDSDRRIVVSLGHRTGVTADLVDEQLIFTLFGWKVHSRPLIPPDQPAAQVDKPPEATEKSAKRQRRPLWETLAELRHVAPKSLAPLRQFAPKLISAFELEELNGRVEAGFDSPDWTGTAFGYYQAALGAMPGVVGRLEFVPVWTGPSFSASGRAAVSIPLYRLIWRMIVLARHLPSKKLSKMAIQKEKGAQDG